MAQREDKKTEIHAHETLTLVLCANNCGLFGNPATNNMCQSCFHRSSHPQSHSPRSAPQATPSPDPSKPPEEAEIQEDAAAAPAEAPAAVSRKVSRCLVCRKRVGLTGFRCRCGDLFCGEHRYSDRHACSFDYKTAARAAIARDNPVVRAAKIVRV